MNDEKKLTIVYSLKLFRILEDNAIYPLYSYPNPKNSKYIVWLFEDSPKVKEIVQKYCKEVKSKQRCTDSQTSSDGC